ncbi:MAG TPA: MlaD family protein, partial [Polyangiales bacterium]
MKKAHEKDVLRAGVFVVVGAIVFTVAIFLLGQKSALFSRTTSLFVQFEDISGLVVGAPVRLAGLEIGNVAALKFSEELSEKKTLVRLVVQSRYLPRIRANSEAFIDSNGLLGDKIVNISMGDPKAAELHDGATLRAGKSLSFDELSASAARALGSASKVAAAVEELVADGRTKQMRDDVAHAAGSLSRLLAEAEQGDGVAHRLLYDRRYADDVAQILAHTRALSARAQTAVAHVDAMLAEVERGDGTLHALIYGEEGKRALSNLSSAAGELSALTSAVREGDGVLHTLIYDRDQGNFLRDLDALTATLNRIVQDVDRGRGTVGGLLRDPTVYEDLKTLLGNVQRNVLFKALVRLTIDQEGLRRVEPAPPAADK